MERKVGDWVQRGPNRATIDCIEPGQRYRIRAISTYGFALEGTKGFDGVYWTWTDQFELCEAKCPICGSDPCACDDDAELDKVLKPVYAHKPLSAQALTSWPSVFDRMSAAKLLNELDEK